MVISQANSLRFRRVDNNLPNFDNVLLANERFYNDVIETYCQRWSPADTVVVQLKSDSDTLPTITVYSDDNTSVPIVATGGTYVTAYDQDADTTNDLFFFEFALNMANYPDESYVVVSQNGITYQSEPFKGDPEIVTELLNGETLKLQYSNFDNAFQIDFSTDITFTLYVKAIIKDYDSGGEVSIYDNQDEIEKLKETVTRIFSFKTLEVPRYLAETLKLASAMDMFTINDVAFTRDEKISIEPVEGHNFVYCSMQVTEKEYLGVNTHDIGFDCDNIQTYDEIMIKSFANNTGATVIEIPASYLLHTLRAQWVSGTAVEIKLGTTVGGDELVYPFEVSGTFVSSTIAVHGDVNRDADTNVYLTITGGVANIDIQLILNIEL